MDKEAVVYIFTTKYYSAIKRNTFESVLMRGMNLESITQSEVSQKEKNKYHILMHIYEILKNNTDEPICISAVETMYQFPNWERSMSRLYIVTLFI